MFLTRDGQIFHVACGYLSADDLLGELAFAEQLHSALRRSRQPAETVVAAHERRLRQQGFTAEQVASTSNPLSDLMMSGPNPKDFGLEVPGLSGFTPNLGGLQALADVDRQRFLKDQQFAMRYPLMTYRRFEAEPQQLVGHHKSFFGSHSALNGLGGNSR